MREKSYQHDKDFRLGNMADDLVDLVLSLCNKDEKHTPVYPERYYSGDGNWVPHIVRTTLSIHENIILANQLRVSQQRCDMQKEAMRKLVYLNHLARISRKKGWISDKQMKAWTDLSCAVYFKTKAWYDNDQKSMMK